jgi:YggT family protein
MGSSYLTNPVEFLVHTLFGLYIMVVMLRFLLQAVRADFYNPISQFLVKATTPLLRPLRRVIPGVAGFDIAAVVLMLALEFIALTIVSLLKGGYAGTGFLLILSAAELVNLLLNIYFWAILIQVILSWVNPGSYNPAIGLIHNLTEPVLRPARSMIPAMGGFDLSPMLVMIGIQLARMLLLPPIHHLANALL